MATAGGLGFKRCGALFIGRLRRSCAGVPERDSGEDRGVTGMAGVREESGRSVAARPKTNPFYRFPVY